MGAEEKDSVMDSGIHFRMEDGSLLTVASRKSGGEGLIGQAQGGDIVFYLARDRNAAAALLRLAGKEADIEVVRKSGRLIASSLRKRSLRYDSAEEKTFRLCFGTFPAPPSIAISSGPAAADYFSRRSLHPGRRKKAVSKLTEEISAHIGKGETAEALELADEIKELPADYRQKAAEAVVKKFAGIVKQIEKDGKFSIPLLLSAHKSLAAVLEKIQPRMEGGLFVQPAGTAMVASVEGDHGEMKGIIMDLFRASGYAVSDGGVNARPDEIMGRLKKQKPAVLALCGLMPAAFSVGTDPMQQLKTCRAAVRKFMKLLDKASLRAGIKVILVGLAFNRKFSREVSADGFYRSLNSMTAGLLNTGKEK